MRRQEKWVLFFCLFFCLAIRFYHIDVPPLEIEESWRQADTESIAWNFANYDFNPLHPNFNYDGPLPNIPALEIQVTTYIIAILYKLFGHHYFLARMVPLIFFLLSAFYLYLFARWYLSQRGAVFSLLIYGILPMNIYYSRAIMPESAALMFLIGGLYYFKLWVMGKQAALKSQTPRKVYLSLILSWLLLSLAIMTKPPVIFIALPMFYLCFQSFQWQWLKFPELWGYALVTLGLSAAYYFFSVALAEYKFTLGISRDIVLKQAMTAFYSQEALLFFASSIPKTLGVTALLLSFLGLLSVTKKQSVILVWFGAMLLEVIFIVSPIRATYYLIFFTVPCTLLAGNLMDRILDAWGGKRRKKQVARAVIAALILSTALESFYQLKPMFNINQLMVNQVKVVQEITLPDDLLVVGALEPCLLSLADRRGWRYNLRNYSYVPEDPLEELNYYIARGAKYFVPIQGKVYGDQDGKIIAYIQETYPKIELIEGYPIYALR